MKRVKVEVFCDVCIVAAPDEQPTTEALLQDVEVTLNGETRKADVCTAAQHSLLDVWSAGSRPTGGSPAELRCACGFVAKSKAGLSKHRNAASHD